MIYGCATVAGMKYLHSSRIIHRDLKSLNVLVDGGGRGRICDFGLSSTRPQAASHVTGVVGTVAWTAPEVLKGWSRHAVVGAVDCKHR